MARFKGFALVLLEINLFLSYLRGQNFFLHVRFSLHVSTRLEPTCRKSDKIFFFLVLTSAFHSLHMLQCFGGRWQVNSAHLWPRADPCVSLLTEETLEGPVNDIWRYELDREVISEDSWVIWELA